MGKTATFYSLTPHVALQGADGPIRGELVFDFQPHGAISLCSKETLFSTTFEEPNFLAPLYRKLI